jgi:hypothetical protein
MTMIGMAIILGIITILTLATLAGLKYFTKAKVNTEEQAITDFKTNVVSYGARVGLFTATNSSLQALINQNFFPTSQVAGTSPNQTVTNQWGGSYTVAVGTIVNAGDSIVLTSTGIPASVCTELGTSLDSTVSVMSINGTATKANGASSNAQTVAANCGGAAGDNNSMVMTVSKR